MRESGTSAELHRGNRKWAKRSVMGVIFKSDSCFLLLLLRTDEIFRGFFSPFPDLNGSEEPENNLKILLFIQFGGSLR